MEGRKTLCTVDCKGRRRGAFDGVHMTSPSSEKFLVELEMTINCGGDITNPDTVWPYHTVKDLNRVALLALTNCVGEVSCPHFEKGRKEGCVARPEV